MSAAPVGPGRSVREPVWALPARRAARVFLLAFLVVQARAVDSSAVLEGWFAATQGLQTWSAQFTQTRRLAALAQPLVAPGRVWVSMPDRFRWELGDPPQTIALRRHQELTLLYPRLRRGERYRLDGPAAGPWQDALALMEAGFPKSRRELESRFRILSVTETNATFTLALEPRHPTTRRFLPEVRVTLATNGYSLQANEVRFADGSTLRNDYTEARAGLPTEDALFEAGARDGYTWSEPAGR